MDAFPTDTNWTKKKHFLEEKYFDQTKDICLICAYVMQCGCFTLYHMKSIQKSLCNKSQPYLSKQSFKKSKKQEKSKIFQNSFLWTIGLQNFQEKISFKMIYIMLWNDIFTYHFLWLVSFFFDAFHFTKDFMNWFFCFF